ncbi:PAL [Mytilus coruscus]|uniref:PAL n=1 Tax=Mytilus coruscus TaxID=42192 RepID=A0A6J8C021_MYTCO|nr:PAL [Mytilus coruscus]
MSSNGLLVLHIQSFHKLVYAGNTNDTISIEPNLKVHVDEEILRELTTNAEYLKEKLKNGSVVYGINTGFGGSADVRSESPDDLQKMLIYHLNAGMGKIFTSDKVRAAMVTRANCLTKAYTGVRAVVLTTLLDLINTNITPEVPLRGSISASGDLIPLSYIAAVMIGREDMKVFKEGKTMSCPQALTEAGIQPLIFGPKEGLGIINACSFTAGFSAPVLYDANLLLLLTQICTGLSTEALEGRTESFHPLIHECLPHIGQKEVARNMLAILEDSKLATTTLDMHLPDKHGVLKQDRYSLRTSPQWLGSAVETLNEACRRITIELNSVNDNPIIDHRTDTILSNGNFQGETMSIAMDQTRQALGTCAKLLFAQFTEVVNERLNFGLPPNLSGCDINHDFGFKGCDIAMSEIDHCVNPMSNHVLSAEMHNQSINSMALVSARFTAEVTEILQMMTANLLLLTVQGVDLRHIRNLVLKEIDILVQEYPDIESTLNKILWYELLFSPEKMAAKVVDTRPVEEQLVVKQQISDKMSALYRLACNGGVEASEQMGKGTMRMYNYIRKDLGIPFFCGQYKIDTWLNQILQSIQSRRIEHVLEDIFAPVVYNI